MWSIWVFETCVPERLFELKGTVGVFFKTPTKKTAMYLKEARLVRQAL